MLLDLDVFLTQLNLLLSRHKSTGSVWITTKRYIPPIPKLKEAQKAFKQKEVGTSEHTQKKPSAGDAKKSTAGEKKSILPEKKPMTSADSAEVRCLVRATDGRRTISTQLRAKDVVRFQISYANLLKVHMDNLKKRKKRTKKAKA